MAHNYGVRYLTLDQFVRYCADLNVKTDNRELEHYEKTGILLPVARVIYPEDYVRLNTLWPLGTANEPPTLAPWPELQRLFDKPRNLPEQYADLQDDELIDSFDREMGKNPFIVRPTQETYKPWDSYNIPISYGDGKQLIQSIVEHRYCYWQVHQLYYIQQYPDLYQNIVLLDHISKKNKKRIFRPWTPNRDGLREFKGMARMFDMLSFWITVDDREHKRTFANIPIEYRVQHLDPQQVQAYLDRLVADAKLVQACYGIAVDDLYIFLHHLIELYDNYRGSERYKLSNEVRNDIVYLAQLIEAISGSEWQTIADELGKRYTFWTKQHFRHLDILTKEHDEARELFTLYAEKYNNTLAELKIPNSTPIFSTAEIDELLDYCERGGFLVLLTALSGMIATGEEYAEKFRRVYLYTNLKNALTALEYLMKDLAGKGNIVIIKPTLNPTIQSVMKNEAWFSLFVEKTKKGLTGAKDSAEFFVKVNDLVNDAELVKSEDAYWARIFLIASLARNLTVHTYPSEDWFYGDLFDEMLRAAIYAVLYSWHVARREKWV